MVKPKQTQKTNKIKKVAFIYLTQQLGGYYVTDDAGYDIQKRSQLGLQYLCAVLEEKGINTNIFDETVTPFSLKQLIEKLKDYDLIGFYCSDSQEEKVKVYCNEIKRQLDKPIIVGGPSTFSNYDFLDNGCDITVYGEGEITLQDIIKHYEGEKKLKDIKGICYKRKDKIVKNPPQELIKNLDELPFPDRSKININEYYDYFLFGMKKPYVTMIASRGCLNRCTFCTSCGMWGFRYRQRSVDNVIKEIDEVVEKYNAKYIAFQDDILGITNEWMEEFCKKIIKKPYRIKWMAILHPFTFRNGTEKIFRLMKKAGCDTLSFGLQSAHPKILKNIRRGPTEPEQLKKTLKIANRLGFITAIGYIFGLPGDTRETIKTTIDYSIECDATLSNYYILSVLRGSEIEQQYKNKEICKLSNSEIEELTEHASRKFYMQPKKILKILYFILKNPHWLIKISPKLPSILARIGFARLRKSK